MAATAVQNQPETKPPADSLSALPLAGLFGAVYIAGVLAAALYAVPLLMRSYVDPALPENDLLKGALRIAAQVFSVIVLALVGQSLAGREPPKGIRGAIFLGFSSLITAFFLSRAAAALIEFFAFRNRPYSEQTGYMVLGGAAAVFVYFAWRFMNSATAKGWAVALEEQGWFKAAPYKKSQGLKVRRLTMLGVLLIFGTGIYTLNESAWLASAPDSWALAIPMTGRASYELPVLPDVRFTLPLLCLGGAVWFAYRLINLPAFADFLVATEAEMNKVSWSSRKQLFRDTCVVLVTLLIMATLLLTVDRFWGWLLSREVVGVLPSGVNEVQQDKTTKAPEW